LKDIKVIRILKTLNSEEMKEFNRFVSSPLFNRLKNVIKLNDLLKKFYPEFKSKALTVEYLFKKLFPGEKFHEGKIRNLFSDLGELTESYLNYKALNSKKFERFNLLNEELHKRNLDNYSVKNINRSLKELEELPFRNSLYFYYKYIFEYQLFYNKRKENEDFMDIATPSVKLEKYFINYFIAELCNLYTPVMDLKNNVNVNYNFSFENIVYDYLRVNYDSLDVTFKIYYTLVNLVKTEEYEYYERLKELVFKNSSVLEENEIYNIHITMHNYILKKMNSMELSYIDEYKNLLDLLLKKNSFKEPGGFLPSVLFRNMANLLLKSGSITKSEQFTEEYSKKLSPSNYDNNYNYCMALVSFYKKEFDASINYLSKVKYADYLLKFQVYTLNMKNFFETGAFENCFSLVYTALQGIARDKESPEAFKTPYRNFFNYFKKLLGIKMGAQKNEVPRILDNLKNENIISSKDWLIEKLNELLI